MSAGDALPPALGPSFYERASVTLLPESRELQDRGWPLAVEPGQPTSALLLGAEESLAALLFDVLGEVGITLREGEERSPRPDLVLVQVHRGESLLSALQDARDGTYPAPIFILLPFADERRMQLALRLGARGCFALGQPLELLRQMVRPAVTAPRSSAPPRIPKVRPPVRGRYDD